MATYSIKPVFKNSAINPRVGTKAKKMTVSNEQSPTKMATSQIKGKITGQLWPRGNSTGK